jgi:hypothetical protein
VFPVRSVLLVVVALAAGFPVPTSSRVGSVDPLIFMRYSPFADRAAPYISSFP